MFTKKICAFAIVILTAIVCFGLSVVWAGVGDNTSGFAWSENIGWISFNNLSDGSAVNYGVNINSASGDLSGYAWSENVGWVSFNRADAGNPPAAPFNGGSGPIAQYNSSTGELTGWMRVLANGGGWDGWIKFYNTTLDSNGDWHGWAWSSEVVGWLSFNSVEGGGSYKVTSVGVVNGSPVASNLGVSSSYCGSAAQYFSWNYSDPESDNEERFQFRVDNNSDFSSPEVNRDYTGLSNPSPTTNNQTVTIAETPAADQLGYNTTYYWQAKVYDINGSDSGWISGPSFTTESHRYPSINFNWSPTEPSAEEDVLFSDQSTVYGGASKSSWSWTFENGNPGSSSQQNPTIQFTTTGDKDVVLGVTDSDGYTCSQTKTVGVQEVLPDWKEILPW